MNRHSYKTRTDGEGGQAVVHLLTSVDGLAVALDGQVGFNRKQAGEGGALLVGELAADAIRGEDGLTLLVRHLAKITEGAGYQAATFDGQTAELLHGFTDLLALRLGKVLQGLVALQNALALLLGHVVELGETIQVALLGLLGKLFEAGFALQFRLLRDERQGAVALHPLGEMLLILLGTDGGFRGGVLL